ncbi:BUB3-interacting and GLEBS motif-containing protein ZNF207-like [Aquarana catesbeiana]|uniref:BUB3-interacting and GLEBS motif-containing protein ZNF207-like n=1 Tax=Aquarana catesbeiana TaxID=8400 RepID=UPI003CC9A0C5
MPTVPPIMPGIPPGMPHGMLQMSGMMHPGPGIPHMMAGLPPGVPPMVGPCPGIPATTLAQQVSAPGVSRVPTPSTSSPAVQSLPKPLFPSAGQ